MRRLLSWPKEGASYSEVEDIEDVVRMTCQKHIPIYPKHRELLQVLTSTMHVMDANRRFYLSTKKFVSVQSVGLIR